MIFRTTNRLHYLNTAIEVVQRLPAGGDDWFLAGGAPMPVAVYNVREGGGLPESYVNVVNPGTYDAAPGVAPTWSGVTGWGLDGLTQYLTTGVSVTGAWSAVVRFSGAAGTNAEVILGAQDATPTNNRFWLLPRDATDIHAAVSYVTPGTVATAAGRLSDGVMGLAGTAMYYNGINTGNGSGTPPTGTFPLFIGARNQGGTAAIFFGGNIQYIAIWNTSTDHATWVPAVSAAVAAL